MREVPSAVCLLHAELLRMQPVYRRRPTHPRTPTIKEELSASASSYCADAVYGLFCSEYSLHAQGLCLT
jgi:hypothetical protein